MNLKNLIPKTKKGLLVHHWDADGICSAALVKQFAKKQNPDLEIETFLPEIGNYFLTDPEIESMKGKGYEFVVIADIALPKEIVLKLKKALNVPITFFDHHAMKPIHEVEHVNPVANGGKSLDNPCCAYVVSEYFGSGFNILSAIGAVGDQEDRIKENSELFPKLKSVLNHYALDFDELLEIVKLLDSNYVTNDPSGISVAVDSLAVDKFSPQRILEDQKLKDNLKQISEELGKLSSTEPTRVDGIAQLYELTTQMNLISPLTRVLSKKNPDKVIVVFDKQKGNIYARRRNLDVDMRKIVKLAKEHGYNAGGKEEVAGIILPPEDIKAFTEKLLEELK